MSTWFVFLTYLSCFAKAEFRVTIDPGHGGVDFGAQKKPVIEKNISLEISQMLKKELQSRDPQVLIQMTRESDKTVTLEDRVKTAEDYNSDLFVSLHANWSPSNQVSGFEFYFGPSSQYSIKKKQTWAYKKQPEVVEQILKDLNDFAKQKKSLEFSSLGQINAPVPKSAIRKAPFYVIENTSMPAVLIEVGFISNRREARKLIDPNYQQEIAQALAETILKYKEMSDK